MGPGINVRDMPKTMKTAFDLVEALLELEGAGVAELADYVDKPTSTVHDYLQGLEDIGCAVNENGTYRVGLRFLSIGERMRNQMDIYQASKPELKDLSSATGEHASLLIKENNLGVLLYTTFGEKAVEINIHAGITTKLHTSAPGKAVLANIPPEQVEQIIDQYGLTARTPNTITDKSKLLEELEGIRDRGYALDFEELFEGMHGIGVPIIINDGVVGAISIYGPNTRIAETELTNDLAKTVSETANVIEVSLKY